MMKGVCLRPNFQVLHVRSEDSGYDQDPKPRFCRPLSPQLFILDETPYLKLVRLTLRRDQLKRPASVLWKYSHLFGWNLVITSFMVEAKLCSHVYQKKNYTNCIACCL